MSKEGYNVTVLNRQDITTYPKLGQAMIVTHITYVAAGLAPKTIRIPKDQYSIEKEKRLIKEDIEARLSSKPESYTV